MNKVQICLLGIQKFAKEKQVIKQLKELFGDKYIEPLQIVKPKMKPFCFISFENAEKRDEFNQMITERKDCNLRVGDVHNEGAFEKQLQKKIKKEHQQSYQLQQKVDQQNREPFERDPQQVALQTAPLHNIAYDSQVEQKMSDLKQVLQKFSRQYQHKLPKDQDVPDWVRDISQIKINEPIECPEQFRYNYRSKSEFTINLNSKNELCIGFNVGSHMNNDDSVERPNACPITPKIAIRLANVLEDYVKSQKYMPFNRVSGEGVWRLLSVRKSDRTKQLIIAVSVNKNNLQEDEITQLKTDLITLFLKEEMDYKLKGILLMHSHQLGQDLPSKLEDTETIYGDNYYEEIILGKTVKISYNAFVQNHIEQCDKMYSEIIKICQNTQNTKFLDICAGSGTIGICVSNSVQSVLAIEMNEQSCKDAEFNYQNNAIENCKIICSKVEDVIKQEVASLKNQKLSLIACLDPPRAGVIQSVVEALRTCKGLDKIVYVSCSPYSVIDNLIYLCMPVSKKYKAPGFRLKSATLVDMFPQTSHFETIFYMERDYGFDPNFEI